MVSPARPPLKICNHRTASLLAERNIRVSLIPMYNAALAYGVHAAPRLLSVVCVRPCGSCRYSPPNEMSVK